MDAATTGSRIGHDARRPDTAAKVSTDRIALLHRSLQAFYTSTRGSGLLARVVVPVTTHQGNLSLRVLDWFVTNFAKAYNTTFTHSNGRPVSVYRDYKAQLKSFTKRYFDPFCRRDRITFSDGETTVTTTVGQLNFFRWAALNGIVEAARDRLQDIEQHMLQAAQQPKQRGTKRKAVASDEAIMRCSSHPGRATLA